MVSQILFVKHTERLYVGTVQTYPETNHSILPAFGRLRYESRRDNGGTRMNDCLVQMLREPVCFNALSVSKKYPTACVCRVPLRSWRNGEQYLAAAVISIFQMLEDIHKVVPRMCNVRAGTFWHNSATAARNNLEIQIPYSKRHKPPPGVRLREERGHPITFSRREIILKIIFVAVDTRYPDGTNDPYYQQLHRAIFRGKFDPINRNI